jgi:16S rRNA (guanine527-N7)-methyltransferase
VSSESVELLGRYVQLVASWNRKLDLTGARDAAAQVEVLLADALVLADPWLVPQASRLLDVGSGAGAPALPVLLLRPDLSALLVEPLRKRVAFLRTALGSLGLVSRALVLEAKLDEATPAVAGAPFDVAMSRATFAPPLWLELGAKLARRTLVLLAAQEPPQPPSDTHLAHVTRYRLPSNAAERCIAVYAPS